MDVMLVDGTYELFRHYFAVPKAKDADGREVGAVRGVVHSLLREMRAGETYIGVATDHVIRSRRNDMWAGYKTDAGVDAELLGQFGLLEEVLRALGVVVWAMEEWEADDALASAAAVLEQDRTVGRVLVCTPDKDLAQCVRGERVVQVDRRGKTERNERGVWEKFGVGPGSIPDYLAMVGDAADGYPGLKGWGPKSAAAVLGKFGRLEAIPEDVREWGVGVSGAGKLNGVLRAEWERALLFRELATLRTDLRVVGGVEELLWRGPTEEFEAMAQRLDRARTERAKTERAGTEGAAGKRVSKDRR